MEKIGRYDVVRTLGRGGMGEVYLGRDPKLERQVALKVLNRDDGADSRGLFEREAKALAALSHPNIVTIFEIADVDGRQFIAMEYLPGRSLRELLLHDRPGRDAIVTICAQVATALAAAHEAGILHRDIKPENVVVGKASSVKVVDFGIARRLDASTADPTTRRRNSIETIKARTETIVDVFTRTIRLDSIAARAAHAADTMKTESPAVDSATCTVFGTPAYMAPEVLMGEPTSTASDVYSLGVMMHECLVGRRPYDAPNLHEVIARVIDGEEAPERIDDPLADLVARMIDRDPGRRPTLAEIGKALSRRRSTVASPPVKRRWLVPVVVLLLAAGTTVAIWRLGTSPAPEVAETPAFRGLAAIRDIELELPSYGTGPDSEAFGRALAQLLRSASVAVISPDELRRRGEPRNTAEWLAAAEEHDARLLVSGSISERQGRAVARFEVLDVITKRVAARTFDADPDRIGVLLHSVASWLADLTNPGITLPQPNRLLAGDLLKLGNDELKEHRSARARTFFEQAVLAEPTSAEAWDRYATSLGMMAAKRSATIAAAARAYELAPEGPRKKILHATLLNYRLEFSAALAELTPLEHAGLTGDNLRDLLFQIGESHWHEGRHDLGFSYFKRTLELDGKFSEAASHAGEYAIARRDEASGREYLRMQRYELEHIDFAVGKYEELVKAGRFPYDLWSQIVLGLPERAPPTPLTRQEQIYKHLTAAAVDNDAALVEAETEKLLANVEPFTAGIGDLLIHMGEVVIAADMKKPVAKILAVLQANQRGYHYRRLAILASPMLGAPKFPRAELTERLVHLTAAIDAELAGDRAQAAKLLGELVDNPTYEWDFVERLALRRNLLALGRTKEADALCADTLRPTTMRYVFKVVQRICKP